VLAIVLSVLSLNYFFLRPGFSFSPISYADLVYLIFCIFCALAVGWVSAVRRRTEQELRQARDELEAKVLERTANLQRSESYLAETQKLTHTGSWAWDARSQKVLYCSEEMFRIYGLDPQVDLPTRKNFRQRVHPEDRSRTDERFVRVVNEKVDSFDEYRVLLPDGTVKHVNSSGHPVLDGNGEFIAFIGTATDVTERKRAEEALRERDAKIRRLVDSNIIGIFFSGLEGRVLEANDAFLDLVGQDRDDLVSGRIRWTDLTPPEWHERDKRALAELTSNTIAQPYEKEFFRTDGSRVPVLVGGALFEEGGDEGVAFVLDLTDRKGAEEAVRESEAKIRRLVDSNIIGIFIWDFDGRILEANDEFLRMVSYDREDLASGRIRWADLTPPDWRDRNNARIEQQKSSGRFEPFEKEFTRKDGSRVPMLIGGATFEEGGNQGVAFVLDLTERKCAEEALREREAKIRRLVDSNIIGIFIWDFDGRVLEANDEFLRMVNYDREDLASGRIRWTDLTPPDWRERDNAKIEQQKISGRLEPFEKEYTRKDGRRVPVLIGVATFEEGGNEGVAFVLDLTERKRAEEALQESERSARSALDGIAGLVAIMTPNGEVETVNRQCVEYFGRPVEEQKGWVTTDMVHPEDLPHMLENFKRAIASEIPYHFEQRLRRFDGEYRWFETRGGAVRDDTGRIVRWYVLLTDIEDRKRAEDALRESEYKLRQIIDAVPGFVWSSDPAGEPTHINQHMSDYGGMRFEDFKLGGWEAIVHPDDYPETAKAFYHAIQTGTPYQDVLRLRRADGEFRWYQARGEPLRDREGRIIQWYGLSVDIDEAKKAEGRLRRSESYLAEAQLQLAHANRVATMGQLTASITHEVNQPITAAVTYASAARRLLSAKPLDLHEVDDVLSLIVKEGNRAGEVVGRIRALIKKAPARKDAVAINDAILEVIALTRIEAANNSVSVRTQLAEGLPRVQGDRVQLQQVLLNLILNAIEAMRDGGEEERELVVSSRDGPDGVSVEVRDSGPGFAPADIGRVFEAFYSTKPNGVGLGLSICRSIIEAHDGRLWASPNVPRGAIFGFIAPAHPAAAWSAASDDVR
jgi:PAS domain S-box-containing protein